MTKKRNKQFGRILSVILSVAMLVTGLPAEWLGGVASVKAEAVNPADYFTQEVVGNVTTWNFTGISAASGNATFTKGATTKGVGVPSSNPSNVTLKKSDTALSIPKDNQIEISIAEDTVAYTLAVRYKSNNKTRYVTVGAGDKTIADTESSVKAKTMHDNADSPTTYDYVAASTAVDGLYLCTTGQLGSDYATADHKIKITAHGGEIKIGYIILTEYKSSQVQIERTYDAAIIGEALTAAQALKLQFEPTLSDLNTTTDGEDKKAVLVQNQSGSSDIKYALVLCSGDVPTVAYKITSLTVGEVAVETKDDDGHYLITPNADSMELGVTISAVQTHKVTFDLNGHGTGKPEDQEIEDGTTVDTEKVNDPEATGYTFGGWFTSANPGEEDTAYDFSTAVTADVNLYAKWTPLSYDVTFDLDGGTHAGEDVIGKTVKYNYDSKVTKPTPDPTKLGHDFLGWFVRDNEGNVTETKYDFGTKVSSDLTLVAKWEAKTFTVAYTANNAGEGSSVTYTPGEASTTVTYPNKIVKPDDPVDANNKYVFLHWLDKEGNEFDFNTTILDENSTILDGTTLNLHAAWEEAANIITVTYKSGLKVDSEYEKSEGKPYVKSTQFNGNDAEPKSITKKQFKFWSAEEEGGTDYFAETRTATADMIGLVLYAQYEDLYDVKFYDEDGKTLIDDENAVHQVVLNAKVTAPADPEKQHYRFAGWKLSGTESVYTADQIVAFEIKNDTKFLAQFVQVADVIYDANGGAFADEAKTKTVEGVAVGSTLTAPDAVTRTGYDFVGWYTAATDGTKFVFLDDEGATAETCGKVADDDETGKFTLYAHWEAGKYTVTFDGNDADNGGTMKAVQFTYGEAGSLPANTFTKKGYVFKGWSTKSGNNEIDQPASGDHFRDQARVSDLGDTTLYAVWRSKEDEAARKLKMEVSADEIKYYGEGATFREIAVTKNLTKQDVFSGKIYGFEFVSNPNAKSSDNGEPDCWQLSDYQLPSNSTDVKDWVHAPLAINVNGVEKTFTYRANSNKKMTDNGGYIRFQAPVDGTLTVVYQTNKATDARGFTLAKSAKTVTTAYAGPYENTSDYLDKYYSTTSAAVATIPLKATASDEYYYICANANINIFYLSYEMPNVYTVSFDTDGGSEVAVQYIAENGKATEPTAPTKAGYDFAGWYKDKGDFDDENKQYSFDTQVTANLVLYAKWTEKPKFTVTFDYNDTTTDPKEVSVTKGGTVDKPTDDPTYTGHKFKGWCTVTADPVTGAPVYTEYDFTTLVTADITLVAKWVEVYKVTFDLGYGTGDARILKTEEVEKGEKVAAPTTDPSRDDYNFVGWFKDTTSETAYNFDTAVTEALTLTAKWEEIPAPKTYTVTFSSEGKTVDTKVVEENGKVSKPENPTREGYDFKGWFTDEAFTEEYDFETPVTAAVTLHAKWEEKSSENPETEKFTVTFDTDGGSNVDAQEVAKDGKATKPADPTKSGYTFKGWFADKDLKTAYDFDAAVTAAITIYAMWEEVKQEPTPTPTPTPTPAEPTIDGEETGELLAEFADSSDTLDVVELVGDRYVHVYTGAKITPAIIVTNGYRKLTESVDYTVKYSNNLSVDKNGNEAKVIVTGKGNYSGKVELKFWITPVDISKEYENTVFVGNTRVEQGAKAAPVVVYNGMKLSAKDYSLSRTDKLTSVGTEYIDIVAQGNNYTGTIPNVPFEVVAKGQLKKLKVELSKDVNTRHTYNGKEQELSIVTETTTGELAVSYEGKALTEGTDFYVSYSPNINAGKVKVTIVGSGEYTGNVTKTFKILPAKGSELEKVAFGTGDGHDTSDGKDRFAFNSAGVTPTLIVAVKSNSPVGQAGERLIQGVDYTVKYSANKKVGFGSYTVSFIGNYKGHSPLKGTFQIVKANLADADVVLYDMAYSAKKTTFGKYMQAPIVMMNDGKELVNKKEYKVIYKLGDADGTELTKKSPVSLSADNDTMTIYVEVVPKSAKSNYTSGDAVAYGTYDIFYDKNNRTDISKAKITLISKTTGKKTSKVYYTGAQITFDGEDAQADVVITFGKGEEYSKAKGNLDANFEVRCVNNVQKGKATIIVTATEANEKYCGSKTGKFTIAASNIKDSMKANNDGKTTAAIKALLEKLLQKE